MSEVKSNTEIAALASAMVAALQTAGVIKGGKAPAKSLGSFDADLSDGTPVTVHMTEFGNAKTGPSVVIVGRGDGPEGGENKNITTKSGSTFYAPKREKLATIALLQPVRAAVLAKAKAAEDAAKS